MAYELTLNDVNQPKGYELTLDDLTNPSLQNVSQSQPTIPKNNMDMNQLFHPQSFGSPSENWNNLRNIATGVMTGSQNIASLLGETGQGIMSFLTGGRAPRVDIREEMGLGKDRPVNFQDYIGPKNPNNELQSISQYIPGMLAGGSSLPGMIAGNAFNMASQASPDQQNASGYLPSGRTGAAIEGGLMGYAPFITGKAMGMIKNALLPVNTESVAKSIQFSHDMLKKSASDIFNDVGQQAEKRNITSVPLRKNLIADISDSPLIPNTEKVEDLLSKTFSGDYSSLRDLQSELWHRATKGIKSPLVSENNAAERLFELRDEVNKSISDHFNRTGNYDLANSLDEARAKYKNLQETYFHRKTPSAIKNLVHEDTREIPKNIMNVLSRKSLPMDRVRAANPVAAENAISYHSRNNAIKKLKFLGTIGGAAGAGYLLHPESKRTESFYPESPGQ